MARTLYGECRGETLDGVIGGGYTIKNRAARPKRFGFTIAEVCRKPLQFSCWNPDDANYPLLLAANIEQPAFMRCLGAAALVLSGGVPDPTQGADHYWTVAAPSWAKLWPPEWSAAMIKTVIIDHHQFAREVVSA